jgi:transaldolase
MKAELWNCDFMAAALKIYLDTFDIESWHSLMPTGLFYGITTNPLLAERAGLDYSALEWGNVIKTASTLGARELHIQVPDTSEDALSFASKRLEDAAPHKLKIVIKVPLTREGIGLASELKAQGHDILMTACYNAKQYVIAHQLNADYIAPYYGRMLEAGIDAKQHMIQMHAIGKSISSEVKVLVASLRSIDQLVELAAVGLTHFTVAPTIAEALLTDKLTQAATSEFALAAKGSSQE